MSEFNVNSISGLRKTIEEGAKELVAIVSPYMNETNANSTGMYVTIEHPVTREKFLVGFTVKKEKRQQEKT